MPMAVLSSLFILTTYLYTTPRTTYLLTYYTCPCPPDLRQVRELASSRDLEGVLDMPRRDGTRIRL